MGANKDKDQHTEDEDFQDDQDDQDGQDGGAGGEEETVESLKAKLAKAKTDLTKANRESAERRRKLEKLEKDEKDRQDAELSEVERLKREKADAEEATKAEKEKAKTVLVRAAFMVAGAKAGVLHPEDAYALADKSGVEVDEDGNVTGCDEAVKSLVESGRVPMRQGSSDASDTDAGAGGARKTKSVKLTDAQKETARRMGLSEEAYAKQLSEMQKEGE